MSKTVSKHCSILNYIRQTDEELHELIQSLCIGRIFIPRRGSPGITFLKPDKALVAKLWKLASGDNPEEAVTALQSMVILDYLPKLEDFSLKKADIPTFLRKKLPVTTFENGVVGLKSGSEIRPDKNFEPRKDRPNIAVYTLSKELVSSDTEVATFANAKAPVKKIKGGAEYEKSRELLFRQVLKEYATNIQCDPALATVMSLYAFVAKRDGKDCDLCRTIRSQLSADTIATLAILLQPMRKSTDCQYVSDDIFTAWVEQNNSQAGARDLPFCYFDNPTQRYINLMKQSASENKGVIENIKSTRDELQRDGSKVSMVQKVYEFIRKDVNLRNGLPAARAVLCANAKLAVAEGELRIFSAILHNDSRGRPDIDTLSLWLCSNCTLDEPYICVDRPSPVNVSLAFYFSTVALFARSDAFLYVAGLGDEGATLDFITSDNIISLNNSVVPALESRSDAAHNAKVAAIQAQLSNGWVE